MQAKQIPFGGGKRNSGRGGQVLRAAEYNGYAAEAEGDVQVTERAEGIWARRGKGGRALFRVRLSEIRPNPAQPRKSFSENAITELAGSIRRYGLLSPLVVRKAGTGYELIAGERRMRALKLLGEEETDAVVLDASDRDSAFIALIENLQRENLSFFEEAEAYQALLGGGRLTREELAARLCRSPSAVANKLRLLKLSPSVRAEICAGGLSERHARALLRLPGEEEQLHALRRAVREQMNVRGMEALIDRMLKERAPQPRGIYRDHRIFVNAMLETVKTIQQSGAGVTSTVVEKAEGVEITVLIPRMGREWTNEKRLSCVSRDA